MRRPHKDAPCRADIDAGGYDAEFLLQPYLHLELVRSSSREVVESAASGGVLTEVCAALLERDEVDVVLHAGFEADYPLFPTFVASSTRQELEARSGSVYVYISPRQLIQAVAAVQGRRMAVVCPPCMVPMVRRWQQRGEHDIRAVFSFFCGYNMTFEATRFLLDKAKVPPGDVEWIRYRHGDYPGGFAVRAGDGREVRFGKEAYEYLNLAFVRSGCYRCALYMGEGADLSCGDAWLREHRSLTAVLVRTETGLAALDAAGDRLERYDLPETTLVHMHLHNLIAKKHSNSMPLRMVAALFQDFLPKRLAPFKLLSWLSRQRRKRAIGVSLPRLTPRLPQETTPADRAGSDAPEQGDA